MLFASTILNTEEFNRPFNEVFFSNLNLKPYFLSLLNSIDFNSCKLKFEQDYETKKLFENQMLTFFLSTKKLLDTEGGEFFQNHF